MITTDKFHGRLAIAIAARFDLRLHSYADPTSPGSDDLTVEEAREIVAADPSLVWISLDEVTEAIPDSALHVLRAEAIQHGDIVQRILCDMAIDGEDSQHDPDCLDAEGRPDYSGGGHTASELREIRAALRMTQDEARVACARAIAAAEAQS